MNKLTKFSTRKRSYYLQVFVCILLITMSVGGVFAQNNQYTVVLDAGHGGRDPGNIGLKKYIEKDIALRVVLKVGKILAKNPNIKVIYTRKTDVFVNLWKRGSIANKANADLFVSIHCNGHHTQVSGTETFALALRGNKKNFEIAKKENSVILYEKDYKKRYKGFDPNSPESVLGVTMQMEDYLDQSILLAAIIQKDFTYKLKRRNRGVKQASFVVLHQTFMPSVLIEMGFISNYNEGKYLNSKAGQQKMASSIARGISKYLNQEALNTVQETVPELKTPALKQEIFKDVIFKVQIAAGKRKLALKKYNFNGLRNVRREKIGKLYKYYYGNTSNYESVKMAQKEAKAKGYSNAFIVAYKNGEKVSVSKIIENSK
ncbi:MAG: N-acetylmuramoyl-L-alanine amidase [Flavobacteriaceae bacterium]|nr:MAG: N-acetylmuramoyl-L-alanine amidase [Flavobacteriaceae bacterium]